MTYTAYAAEAEPLLTNEDFSAQRAFLEVYRNVSIGHQGSNIFGTIEPHRHKEAPKPQRCSHRFKPTALGDMTTAIYGCYRFTNVYMIPALVRPDISSGKAPNETDVTFCRALAFDGDTDHGLAVTAIAGLEPTFIIQTSITDGKQNLQCHYVFERPISVPEFKELSELGFGKCGGDPCCKNAAQLFRIPTTWNHPGWKKIEEYGRSPEPQPVRIIGGSFKPLRVADIRAALEAMPDRPQPGKAPPVEVGNTIDATAKEALLARIQAENPHLFQLMNLEHKPDDPRRDRSAHFAYGTKCLFEMGLTIDEVAAVANGAPFAKKFAGRVAQRVAREHEIWSADLQRRAAAEQNWKRLADNVVQHPRAEHTAFDGRGGAAPEAEIQADAPGSQEPGGWPEPGAIDAPLYHVTPFNAGELLPEGIRDFVTDVAYRMPCSEDYVAAALIAMVGATVGARCGIKPKRLDDWIVVPNLWGGIVGDPSQKKTPPLNEAMKPISRLVAKDEGEFKEAQEDRPITKLIRDAQKTNIEDKLKKAATGKDKNGNLADLTKELKQFIQTDEPEPVMRRRKTNDASIEKLGELLRDNPRGILVTRDEIVGLLATWDRAGHEGDRAFFLEAWNGTDSFDTDRIGRGSIFIPNLCVSVFGGIQPDKLIGYLEQAANALGNDGMLQRFQLLVYPDPVPWEYRDAIPDRKSRERVNDIFECIDSFDPIAWGAEAAGQFAKFPHFSFAPDAQEVYIDFSTELHRTIDGEDNPLIRQHLAKYDKLFPALALILHLIECADTGKRGPLTKRATLMAAAWCRYLEKHARRCYGLIADEGLRAAQMLAKRLREYVLSEDFDPSKHFNPEDFTVRGIRRHRWRYLTTDEAIEAALDWLEDEGWVRRRQVGGAGRGTGRPTFRYQLNPRVRSGKEGAA